jgi:hypothetical protein
MSLRADPNLFAAPGTQSAAPTWPSAGEADELLRSVTAQAATINQQFWLLADYQNVLDAAQEPPPAHGTGTGSGTNLVITGSSGVITVGSAVTGVNVPAGCTVVGQQSGPPGGDGTYTTSVATTAAATVLTFTPGGGPSAWPVPRDVVTLNAVLAAQTAIIRNQTALVQQYQELLNASQTPAS